MVAFIPHPRTRDSRTRRADRAMRAWRRAVTFVAALEQLPDIEREREFTLRVTTAALRVDLEFVLAVSFLYNATWCE